MPEGLPVTAHASETVPVNPPLGVIVTVEVVELPAWIMVNGLMLIENDGDCGGGGGGGGVTACAA